MKHNRDLAQRLTATIEGAVLTDPASRARYATDASIYQMVPEAVVLPQSASDVAAAMSEAPHSRCAGPAPGAVVPRSAGKPSTRPW